MNPTHMRLSHAQVSGSRLDTQTFESIVYIGLIGNNKTTTTTTWSFSAVQGMGCLTISWASLSQAAETLASAGDSDKSDAWAHPGWACTARLYCPELMGLDTQVLTENGGPRRPVKRAIQVPLGSGGRRG